VSALIDAGGWDKLNQCYLSAYTPSASTQILHPDKYLTGETAISVITPTTIFVDNVWTRVPSSYGYLSDTYGEYFIYVMLNRWFSDSYAQTVAAEWVGDSFSYYELDCDFLFVWNITWRDVQGASMFSQAFIDMLHFAQANSHGVNVWCTNGRHLTLIWDQNTASTLILCSTNQTVIESSLFTY
jgi:hypothetical protein